MKTTKFRHGRLKHLFSQFEGDTNLQEIWAFALPPLPPMEAHHFGQNEIWTNVGLVLPL